MRYVDSKNINDFSRENRASPTGSYILSHCTIRSISDLPANQMLLLDIRDVVLDAILAEGADPPSSLISRNANPDLITSLFPTNDTARPLGTTDHNKSISKKLQRKSTFGQGYFLNLNFSSQMGHGVSSPILFVLGKKYPDIQGIILFALTDTHG